MDNLYNNAAIKSLEKTVRDLKGQVSFLSEHIEKFKRENDTLRHNNNLLEEKCQKYRAKNDKMLEEVANLRDEIEKLKSRTLLQRILNKS